MQRRSLTSLQNRPPDRGQCANPVEQRSPRPPPDRAEHACFLPLFLLSFLSLMFMDFLSIHIKAVVLNNDEVLSVQPCTVTA